MTRSGSSVLTSTSYLETSWDALFKLFSHEKQLSETPTLTKLRSTLRRLSHQHCERLNALWHPPCAKSHEIRKSPLMARMLAMETTQNHDLWQQVRMALSKSREISPPHRRLQIPAQIHHLRILINFVRQINQCQCIPNFIPYSCVPPFKEQDVGLRVQRLLTHFPHVLACQSGMVAST